MASHNNAAPPLIITTDLDSGSNAREHGGGGDHADNDITLAPPIGSNAGEQNGSAVPVTPPRIRTAASPQDASHLSPMRTNGAGLSPTSTALSPPSPTLTNTSSVHFSDDTTAPSSPVPAYHSSLALRDNNPTAQSGMETLQVVPGRNGAASHQRHGSIATYASGTEVGDDEVKRAPSNVTSGTAAAGAGINPAEVEADAAKKLSWREKRAAKKAAIEEARNASAHIDPDKDTTDPTPFKEKPSRLAMLVDPKSLDDLTKLGGAEGVLEGLGVDGKRGLSSAAEGEKAAPRSSDDLPRNGKQWTADLEDRRRVYGRNDLPVRPSKSLLQLMWIAFKDKVLILLTVAAVISLALGIYQDVGAPPEYYQGPDCPQPLGCEVAHIDWVEGVAICVAIIIVVMVGAINDWQKERQFKKLNAQREDRTVKVIRSGSEAVINVKDLVVGDIAMLEPGEIIPVDGIFLRGHNVRCDESGATGESDAIKKFSYDECMDEKKNAAPGDKLKKDCFLISGAKVLEGVGEYIVISVGTNSFNGRIMMSMRTDTEQTPLQSKLNNLAELIAKAGAGSGLTLFTALMIRFFVNLAQEPNRTPNEKAQAFIQILIISVTLVVVAVPEGLPLAVTLALAFATKRMTKQNLLVRVLGSCETMANATVVCTDKTGTLTQNVMSVVAGSLGVRGKFVRNLSENAGRTNADETNSIQPPAERADFSVDQAQLNEVATPALQNLLNEAICINSTAFEDKNEEGQLEFVGSKTETALLRFAKELGWADYKKTRDAAKVVQMIPFSSELKAMGVVIRTDNGYRLYLKGASEILTKLSNYHVVVQDSAEKGSDEVEVERSNEQDQDNIKRTIIFYANQSLRTIALCYRDFESWPPAGAEDRASDDVPFDLIARDMTLIAITGIEDPLRPGVREAVEQCQHAGVAVKMCTGDNVLTARSIAYQCGIFQPGGIVMEGPVFRKLSDKDRLEVVTRLNILARSSPEDKRLLVKTLKSMGEVVGVTGDGTNDGPALKIANVGFAMGIAGTEVAKEASDIILMDDAFSNIVLAIMWGRCVNDSVRKFLQFQLSVNITAVVITFVSAVASNSEESVLSAVQLLWVNLIMDTFAALALATDPATRSSLDRKPDRKSAPLISVDMLKMIVIQAFYQIVLCFVLHFAGYQILGMEDNRENAAELKTLVFNVFVFCQIFNQLNCRRLDRKFNVLEGFFRNYYFMGIFLIMVGGQILIVEVGGAAFQVTQLYGRDWAISIIAGLVSLPVGALVRILPTEPFERFLVKCRIYRDPNQLPAYTPDMDDEDTTKYEYNPALEDVQTKLSTYANIRGGRLRGDGIVMKSRRARMKEANIQPASLLAMVPTVIAGTIGAGAHWINNTSASANTLGLSNPAGQDPSRSQAELYAGKVQLHPDTDPNDPMFAKFGISPEKKRDAADQV